MPDSATNTELPAKQKLQAGSYSPILERPATTSLDELISRFEYHLACFDISKDTASRIPHGSGAVLTSMVVQF